jgi:PAS domain S-box-containing protein
MRGADVGIPSTAASLTTHEEHAAVYAAVVASALDAVIVVDEAGFVISINPAAELTFGYSLDEAIGRQIADLIVPEHLKAAHNSGMARYRATHEPKVLGRRVAMEACCKDGRIIPVELAITEVNLTGRRLFTANLRDLSAAHAAEAEITRQRDLLHQSEKLAALGSLLAGVAHELNNPLSIVLGQAGLLREEVEGMITDAPLAQRAEKIEAAALRCAKVVRSFLAIARQRKASRRAVPVAPLLDASVDAVLYGLTSSGVSIQRDYDRNLPDVFADPDQTQQILVNLLVNASQALEDFAGPREISISARLTDTRLGIVVADSGPGVPADIAERIFDPFFTTKPQGVGTGIGLPVSRGLAGAQGGDLALVHSHLGGAAFELTLPVARPVAAKAEPAPLPAASSQPLSRRALVIDDEPEIALVVAEVLHKAGYQCDLASGGRDAQSLIAVHDGSHDLVVCDLRMPDVDGPSLFRWIQANYPGLAQRVLFTTGDALGAAAGRFLAESQRPVLEKPFASSDILRLAAALDTA